MNKIQSWLRFWKQRLHPQQIRKNRLDKIRNEKEIQRFIQTYRYQIEQIRKKQEKEEATRSQKKG